MSRKSKKGFKRLENHELTEFTTLNGGAGDSESEDLLDLTGGDEHETRDRCYSCCCWGTCLYLFLLTFMVAILGVFCGYLMYNIWQINSDTNAAHRELKGKLDAIQTHLDELRKDTNNKFIVVHHDVGVVNSSVVQLQAEAKKLSENIASLETRLKVIESQPQEKLIEQVDSIHHEMSLLNRNMNLLNHSLEDVQVMRERVASMGSIMDSYDATFTGYQRQIGDLTQTNTQIRNDVIAADNRLKSFGDQLSEVQKSITTSHDQMKQSDDLLSAQLTQLQSLVFSLNDTLNDEVERVWTNISKVESTLESVEQKLSSVEEKLETDQKQNPGSPASTAPPVPPVTQQPDLEPTHPPLTTSTAAASNVATVSSSSTTQGEGGLSSTGDVKNTNVPTGEPTTPLTESTESHATGATGDVPQVDEGEGLSLSNESSDAGGDVIANSTESELATMEGGVTSTTEGVPPSDSGDIKENMEKTTNEQAIAALKLYLDDFYLMDFDLDGKLSQSEMKKTTPQIFMLLDSDGDGYVTEEELQHMMKVLQAKHDTLTGESENAN